MHTLGVAFTASMLAHLYDGDPDKAMAAGLLHDCAKDLTKEERSALCERYDIRVTDERKQNPELLHAPLGAAIAEDKFGVTDRQILDAVTYHTTGRPAMGLLEKIIYVADFIEPGRRHIEGMDEIRRLAMRDLDKCLLRILGDIMEYLKATGKMTDSLTSEAFNYYNKRELHATK